MIDRAYLESRANWIATFEQKQGGDKFVCLMQSRPGGYYWHLPNYERLFPSGATASFHPGNFWDAIRRGRLKHVSGDIPEDLNPWKSPNKENS